MSGNKEKLSLAIDPGLVQAMRELADEDGTSLSAAVNEALAWYIRDRAMAALVSGEGITEEQRDEVRREWREAGIR